MLGQTPAEPATRAGPAGGRDPLLVLLALVVPLLLALPAVLLAGALLLGWRLATARRPLPWACLVAGAGVVVGLSALGAQRTGASLPVLQARYAAAQLGLLRAAREAALAGWTWPEGLPAPAAYLWTYLGGVAPLAVPAGAVLAAGLDGWLRRRGAHSALGTREAEGVVVPPRVARRAARGVAHPPDGWALGYRADGHVVAVRDAEARHHTVVCGAPGSGKTTLLRHLVAGVAGRCPLVVVDCKASRALREAVVARGGVVWEIGGVVRWDALRGDPTALADKLLAAEPYAPAAAIYRAAAARYLQWVGDALDLAGEPRDPPRIGELLAPAALAETLRRLHDAFADGGDGTAPGAEESMGLARVKQIAAGLGALGHAEAEGVAGFAARYGVVVEGVAGRSLGTGPGALVLEAAIRAGRTVLFSLDAAAYPHLAAKLGAWALLDLVWVAGALQAQGWADTGAADVPGGRDGRGAGHAGHAGRQCYVVVDEFSALGEEGRHIVPLLARAREAGLACLLATQGLADLAAVLRPLPQQVLQNTAVRVVLRQGSAEDAATWARTLGRYEREELSRHTDETGVDLGRATARWRPEYHVGPDALQALGTGEAVVAVAPLGGRPGRLERILVAAPPPGDGPPAARRGGTGMGVAPAAGVASVVLRRLLPWGRGSPPHPAPAAMGGAAAPDGTSGSWGDTGGGGRGGEGLVACLREGAAGGAGGGAGRAAAIWGTGAGEAPGLAAGTRTRDGAVAGSVAGARVRPGEGDAAVPWRRGGGIRGEG